MPNRRFELRFVVQEAGGRKSQRSVGAELDGWRCHFYATNVFLKPFKLPLQASLLPHAQMGLAAKHVTCTVIGCLCLAQIVRVGQIPLSSAEAGKDKSAVQFQVNTVEALVGSATFRFVRVLKFHKREERRRERQARTQHAVVDALNPHSCYCCLAKLTTKGKHEWPNSPRCWSRQGRAVQCQASLIVLTYFCCSYISRFCG